MADMILDTSGSVVLNASGTGTVTLTPQSFQTWTVNQINVRTTQTTTQTPVPQCTVYLGALGDGNIICQTWMGNRATASGNPVLVQPSQPLIVVWENGISGTTATVSINGTMAMR